MEKKVRTKAKFVQMMLCELRLIRETRNYTKSGTDLSNKTYILTTQNTPKVLKLKGPYLAEKLSSFKQRKHVIPPEYRSGNTKRTYFVRMFLVPM